MKKLTFVASAIVVGLLALRAEAAGFDCVDNAWCVGVTQDGRIFTGNPAWGNGMHDTKMRAWKNPREIRNVTLHCVPNGQRPEHAYTCFGFDDKGRYYGGQVQDPGQGQFFRDMTE